MADNFQASKVAANEQSSASKYNNFVQAVEDAVNSLDDSNIQTLAAIAVAKLAAGSNGDVLSTVAGVPTWSPPVSGPSYQTTLPGSPTNGQETIYVDSTTAPTFAWRFRYNSAKSSNKWDFIGGSAGYMAVSTSQSTTSSSYTDLATVGPAFFLPFAGDYDIVIEAEIKGDVNTAYDGGMSYAIGAAAASTADELIYTTEGGTNRRKYVRRLQRKTALAGLQALTAKYKSDGTNGMTFAKRVIYVTPVAVGG